MKHFSGWGDAGRRNNLAYHIQTVPVPFFLKTLANEAYLCRIVKRWHWIRSIFQEKQNKLKAQYGGEVWQGRKRRKERQTGTHILMSSALKLRLAVWSPRNFSFFLVLVNISVWESKQSDLYTQLTSAARILVPQTTKPSEMKPMGSWVSSFFRNENVKDEKVTIVYCGKHFQIAVNYHNATSIKRWYYHWKGASWKKSLGTLLDLFEKETCLDCLQQVVRLICRD